MNKKRQKFETLNVQNLVITKKKSFSEITRENTRLNVFYLAEALRISTVYPSDKFKVELDNF